MKKEIRFRVWTGQQMEYRVMAGFLGVFYVQGIDEKDSASMSPFNTKYPDDIPLMEFTGIKDKNGIDIWESDIVKTTFYRKDGTIHSTENSAVIWGIYGDGEYVDRVECWTVSDEPLSDTGGLWGSPVHDYEVIGNIYENPQLLE